MTEWLEADGLGGFASGVASGPRTRRYHALLLSARRPPVERFVLVNGIEAWIEEDGATIPLTTQKYLPNVLYPDGNRRIESFASEPWPEWVFRLPSGRRVRHGLFAVHGRPATALYWRLEDPAPGPVALRVRPLLSGRDYHAEHHENPDFRFDPVAAGGGWRWEMYPGVPPVTVRANGRYRHEPTWYRNFLYDEERARGLADSEDLASPGVFEFDLGRGEAFLQFQSDDASAFALEPARDAERRRRAAFRTPLDRAADAYLVRRGGGLTIVAGYPWFTDWGRDSFISLRGLCLATGRFADAEAILLEWARALSDGMMPNRFADAGEAPEFNSVDASLWFVVACHDFERLGRRAGHRFGDDTIETLNRACETIAATFRKGTRYHIGAAGDGLLSAGVQGVALTWMDAVCDGTAFTPRIGKPVEIQALWLAALMHVSNFAPVWAALRDRARASFEKRFWNEAADTLFDVVDAGHQPNARDGAVRPNALFAAGGLPWTFLDLDRARRVVATCEKTLLTPAGLRTLAPSDGAYRGRYEGGPRERDAAYHQGTAWPWLMGAFVEAWVRTHGDDARARREARDRFLAPLAARIGDPGAGHLPEIADGDAPHLPRGCPFQAWSVGEFLRLDRLVLS